MSDKQPMCKDRLPKQLASRLETIAAYRLLQDPDAHDNEAVLEAEVFRPFWEKVE
jgi:hypothetical protein